ncbi:MAG: hypothetical protein FWC70_05385 [Defluviitaleaceae bacterium]|nr:hypothetical protein [Defluviitaleaceae bacterium]
MSLKRLMAAGMVAVMLTAGATGCSANTPERNQGNRNGQRVSDAVNHRPDSYTGRTNRGLFGLRGNVNRAAREVDGTVRETAADFRENYRSARRSTFGRPQARIGNTFRRGADRNMARRVENTYEMNRTERGMSGMNRAARRAGVTGVTTANADTVPVFFNKKQATPAPEAVPAPTPAPAPAQ